MRVLRGMLLTVVGIGVGFLVPTASEAAGCESPRTEAETLACLEAEFRDTEVRINQMYERLMQELAAGPREALQAAQRAWATQRARGCGLDPGAAPGQGSWATLQDYAPPVCVVRVTQARLAQVEALAARTTPPPAEPSPPATSPDEAYEQRASFPRTHGQWYFEVAVIPPVIALLTEATLGIGVGDGQGRLLGTLVTIRRRDRDTVPFRLGFALDLDAGQLYLHREGSWLGGAPGSGQGRALNLGGGYTPRLIASAPLLPILETGGVQVTLGGSGFAYPLPAGYRPYLGR